MILAVFLCVSAASALDWGADLGETYADTRADTSRSGTFDQQYRVHANGQLVPSFDYFTSLSYRHLQTTTRGASGLWQSELLPAVSGVWSLPFLKLRSDFTYRDNRDQNGASRLTGRSVGVIAQTVWQALPRVTGRYQSEQNVNNLDLLGIDTRQRTIGVVTDYSYRSTSVRYEYADSRTENRRTGLEQTLRRHMGHIENYLSLLNHQVTVQSSYEIAMKSERERQGGGDGVLIFLSPVAGLWAVNPNPELGELLSVPALIDGNLDSAASQQMDLSGNTVQNFGLDFGSQVNVDHLFIYADSLANPSLRWALYTSNDNLTWTQVLGNRVYPFSVVFRRYEMTFPVQVTRYIKLVLEPQPEQNPVFVTEIRGLLTRTANSGEGWQTDHEASLHAGYRPAKWIAAAVDGTLLRHGAGPTSLSRRQDGLMGSVHLSPVQYANLSAQYQLNRTEYPDALGGKTDTELLGLSLISHWLKALQSTAAVNRQRETTGGILTRRLESGSLRLDAALIPGLGASSEAGLTEDHRFLASDLFETRYIGQSVQAQPLDRIQFVADYRYYWLQSTSGRTPPYRENISLQWNYRLTTAVQLSGTASRFREAGRIYATWEGLVSWTPTEKLLLSGGANRTLPDQGSNTLLLTAQGIFHWSSRSDISVSYSHLDSEQASQENFSSLRLAFTYRI